VGTRKERILGQKVSSNMLSNNKGGKGRKGNETISLNRITYSPLEFFLYGKNRSGTEIGERMERIHHHHCVWTKVRLEKLLLWGVGRSPAYPLFCRERQIISLPRSGESGFQWYQCSVKGIHQIGPSRRKKRVPEKRGRWPRIPSKDRSDGQ